MLGAIAGDVCGSPYEGRRRNFQTADRGRVDLFDPLARFTDDTVLICAVADAYLNGKSYAEALREWGHRYPNRGYGPNFNLWLGSSDPDPYRSCGNGAAMRVSALPWLIRDQEELLREVHAATACTHDHPQGLKGAASVALAVWLTLRGVSKGAMASEVENLFGCRLDVSLDEVRPGFRSDLRCQETVPVALRAYLEGRSWEDCVQRSISVGGDSDTIASITGAVAEAAYGVPERVVEFVRARLPQPVDAVLVQFLERGARQRYRAAATPVAVQETTNARS